MAFDTQPSTDYIIYFSLENNSVPVSGATIVVSVVNPSGTTIVTAQTPTAVTGQAGTYSYTIDALLLANAGTYAVTWVVSAPIDRTERTNFTVGSETLAQLNRKDVRWAVARRLGDLWYGKLTSYDTSTKVAVDLKLVRHTDGALKGNNFYVYSGLGVGQENLITDNDQSSTSITFTTAFTTDPDSTSYWEMHKFFTVDDYNDAIKLAILDVSNFCSVPVISSDFTLGSNTYEYNIPTGMSQVYMVEIEWATDIWQAVSPSKWSVNRAERKIQVHPRVTGAYGDRAMRLRGLRVPTNPLHDSTIVEVSSQFIIPKTASLLCDARLTGRESDTKGWALRKQTFEGEAMMAKRSLPYTIPANTRKVDL